MKRALVLVLVAGCYNPKFPQGISCSAEGECPEGQVCASDDRCYDPEMVPDADAGGEPAECEPNAITCVDDVRTVCGDDGTVLLQDTCVLGCSGTECILVDPSNGHAEALGDSKDGPSVTLAPGATLNTDTGVVRDAGGKIVSVPFESVPAPSGTGDSLGVPLGVFRFHDLTVDNLSVEGTSALVIVSYGEVRLTGRLDLAARADGGPGALLDCGGGGNDHQRVKFGAGFMAAGADGAIFNTDVDPKNLDSGGGGVVLDSNGNVSLRRVIGSTPKNPGTKELVPLRGGCPGGAEPGSNSEGGGGGAVQIISNTRILLTKGAAIVAGGAGGFRDDGNFGSGGAGGGSGGGVLLEAPAVELEDGSGIAVNGGGGGSWVAHGKDAELLTTDPTEGASGSTAKGGGGLGASLSAPGGSNGENRSQDTGPTDESFDAAPAGGGGGGGLGRIRINTTSGVFDPPAGVILSPEPSIGVLPNQ